MFTTNIQPDRQIMQNELLQPLCANGGLLTGSNYVVDL